jgi:hypothetical protein
MTTGSWRIRSIQTRAGEPRAAAATISALLQISESELATSGIPPQLQENDMKLASLCVLYKSAELQRQRHVR